MPKQDKIAHTIIKLDAGNRLQHFVFLLKKAQNSTTTDANYVPCTS